MAAATQRSEQMACAEARGCDAGDTLTETASRHMFP